MNMTETLRILRGVGDYNSEDKYEAAVNAVNTIFECPGIYTKGEIEELIDAMKVADENDNEDGLDYEYLITFLRREQLIAEDCQAFEEFIYWPAESWRVRAEAQSLKREEWREFSNSVAGQRLQVASQQLEDMASTPTRKAVIAIVDSNIEAILEHFGE